MRKRHPAYVIFLVVMAALALAGAALMIYGSMHHVPLPGVQPGAGMVA